MSSCVISLDSFVCCCSNAAAKVAIACISASDTSFMSAPFGDGCVRAAILSRKWAGTNFQKEPV